MSILYGSFRLNAVGDKLEAIRQFVFKDAVEFEGVATFPGGITTSGGITSSGGITASGPVSFPNGVVIAGVTYSSGDGTPEEEVTGNRKGDRYTDYTNGHDYIFQGTADAKTGWVQISEESG